MATLPILIAALAVVVAVLGVNPANLLTSWVYWALALLVAISGIVLLVIYCVRRRALLGLFTLVVVLAAEIFLGFGILAVVEAYKGLDCQNAISHIEKGRDLQKANQEDRAYGEYGLATSSCEAGRAYLYRGEIDTDFGRLPLALDDANLAATFLHPEEVRPRQAAYLRIGQLNTGFGNCDAAVAAFQAGIAVNKDFDPLYHNLALVRAAQGLLASSIYPGGSYPGAFDEIQIALTKNPNSTEYLLTRAKILWVLRDYNNALLDLRRVAQIGPKSGDNDSPAKAASIVGAVQRHAEAPDGTFEHNCH